ncbi:hypothetical protein TE1_010 [Escherichia phage vB_EcoS_fTaEco01]|nr:hypothetical protein KE1_011 [Escherichia phage vB_EcoS_fKuEco01]QNO11874.1 hypothetical protein TE1_010 [Escherichia phage vB_EcoS_fTaEco01]
MAKTKSEIFTLIGQELPDNTTGLITPAKPRGVYPQVATVTAWGTAPSALLVISRLEAA